MNRISLFGPSVLSKVEVLFGRCIPK